MKHVFSEFATFEHFQTLSGNLDESTFRSSFFEWKKKPENSDETRPISRLSTFLFPFCFYLTSDPRVFFFFGSLTLETHPGSRKTELQNDFLY